MAIPDYQSLMLPLLKIAADGEQHSLYATIEQLSELFSLIREERNEMLPSGTQAKFDNRVGWASTYLRKAGLFESTGRGKFRITIRGAGTILESHRHIRRWLRFGENKSWIEQY